MSPSEENLLPKVFKANPPSTRRWSIKARTAMGQAPVIRPPEVCSSSSTATNVDVHGELLFQMRLSRKSVRSPQVASNRLVAELPPFTSLSIATICITIMVFSNITNTVTGQQSTLSKVASTLKLKAKKPARPRIVVQLPHVVAAAAASTPIPPTKYKPTKRKTKKSSASRPRIVVQLPHIVGDAPAPILSTAERVLQWQPPKRYGDVLVDGILSPKEYLTQHGHYDETGSWRLGKYASSSTSSTSSYDSDDDYIPYIPRFVAPSLAPVSLKRKRSMEDFSRRVKVAQGKTFFDEKGAVLYNPLEDTDGDYDF